MDSELAFYTHFSWYFLLTVSKLTIKEWCQKLNFLPGGEYLPYDWVEEGKLLLFIKDESTMSTRLIHD